MINSVPTTFFSRIFGERLLLVLSIEIIMERPPPLFIYFVMAFIGGKSQDNIFQTSHKNIFYVHIYNAYTENRKITNRNRDMLDLRPRELKKVTIQGEELKWSGSDGKSRRKTQKNKHQRTQSNGRFGSLSKHNQIIQREQEKQSGSIEQSLKENDDILNLGQISSLKEMRKMKKTNQVHLLQKPISQTCASPDDELLELRSNIKTLQQEQICLERIKKLNCKEEGILSSFHKEMEKQMSPDRNKNYFSSRAYDSKRQNNIGYYGEPASLITVKLAPDHKRVISMTNINESYQIKGEEDFDPNEGEIIMVESLIRSQCLELKTKLEKIMEQQSSFHKVLDLSHHPQRKLLIHHQTQMIVEWEKVTYEECGGFVSNMGLQLKHINIQLIYYQYQKNNCFIFLKQAIPSNTTLQDAVEKAQVPQQQIPEIIGQLLRAVCYLRSKRMFHGELRAENIVYYQGTVKIRKVECCKQVHDNLYCPPEFSHLYLDIWSIGMITYQLYMGKQGELRQIHGSPFPQHIPPEAVDFIRYVLQKNPAHRPSMEEILAHDFLLLAHHHLQARLLGLHF